MQKQKVYEMVNDYSIEEKWFWYLWYIWVLHKNSSFFKKTQLQIALDLYSALSWKFLPDLLHFSTLSTLNLFTLSSSDVPSQVKANKIFFTLFCFNVLCQSMEI